jgi:PKD repeat protein
VTLTVTTDGGQTDTSTQRVTVDNPPSAAITVSTDAVPTGGTVAFDGSKSVADEGGSITDYGWDFGDGTSAVDRGTDPTANHTFTSPGTYTVTLTTTDDLNVIGTTTQVVTVAPFTVSAPIPAPDDDVTFTAGSPDAACGTVTGYSWNFGDGTPPETGPDRTVVHNFTDRDSYTVSLSFQCSDTQVPDSSATVVVDTPPTAAFTPSITAFRPGTTVSFDAGGSHAATGGRITDYAWSFGDGSPVVHTGTTTTTITHPFTSLGVYTVTLTTTDDLGASATVSQQVTADEPTAAFTVSASPTQNFPVTFDARATDDPESTITHYTWNFGDGSSVDAGTAPITTHSFSAVGTYTVKLAVTDAFGFTDTTSRQLVVAAPVTETSNPPTTSTSPIPPAPVITSPTPTPPSSGTPPPAPLALVARLSGGGRQRLARVLSHGIRLGLAVNQPVRANWQVTLPLAQTRRTRHTVRRAKDNGQLIVVLLRRAQTLAPGTHTITLRLSRAAIRRLATRGSLVLTIRVAMTTSDGRTLTRTAKLRLTRP